MRLITIDDKEYEIDLGNQTIKQHMVNIEAVDELILQANNELQIAQTAKMGYSRALKRELEKTRSS
jgi:hypothetical protein